MNEPIVQRIGRSRLHTLYPSAVFQIHRREYTTYGVRLCDRPVLFSFPEKLPLTPSGIPVIPGGIHYFASARLEQQLGIQPGMGKFAAITGTCFEGDDRKSWLFRVSSPASEQTINIMLLVAWAPDLKPMVSSPGFSIYRNSEAFSRIQPREVHGALCHGLDFWIISGREPNSDLFDILIEAENRRFGRHIYSEDEADKARATLEHLEPLLRRHATEVVYEQDFFKLVHNHRKWFAPYSYDCVQELVNALYSKGFYSALGRKLPLGVFAHGQAIARTLR